ncbi:signal peptidase I [Bacteroides sp. 214]|uniref:signal peptidase I n=1 Tax=Bacteroides sp. 214 TaxID=2302935 RepID=UPI0019402199|nr:signal peptidase I [Bacteroides sp. 214]NDW12103.1 signal peptidase I [Bacteroides sp. 214]
MIQRNRWIILFIGAAIIVLLLRNFLCTPYYIPSSGMENTLFCGDRVLVHRWSYGLRLPHLLSSSYQRVKSQEIALRDVVVFNNPADKTQPIIEKRSIFINRCLGRPGDTLRIDSMFRVSSWEKAGPDRKELFAYPISKARELDSLLITLDLVNPIKASNDSVLLRSFSRYELYLLEQAAPITWLRPALEHEQEEEFLLVIPAKGKTIDIHPWNATIYANTILLHEYKAAEVRNDSLYIENRAVSNYTFCNDYYWMASDNASNFLDSRSFGFVPHTHIIGKALFVWFSKEPDTDFFDGYRWDRLFKAIK